MNLSLNQYVNNHQNVSGLVDSTTMNQNINNILSTIHDASLLILDKSNITGDIDYCESNFLFESMKEAAQLNNYYFIDPDLKKLHDLCLKIPDVNDISETEGLNGFSNEWKELPIRVAKSCPALMKIHDLKKAVSLLSSASSDLDIDDRNNFLNSIIYSLEGFDLLGEETINKIFNNF